MKFVKKWERIAREVTRVRILILADNGKHNDEITSNLDVDHYTVLKIKKRYLEGDVDKTLHDDPISEQTKSTVIQLWQR